MDYMWTYFQSNGEVKTDTQCVAIVKRHFIMGTRPVNYGKTEKVYISGIH